MVIIMVIIMTSLMMIYNTFEIKFAIINTVTETNFKSTKPIIGLLNFSVSSRIFPGVFLKFSKGLLGVFQGFSRSFPRHKT